MNLAGLGRVLLLAAGVLALPGVLLLAGGRLPWPGHLPGERLSCSLPLATSLPLSLIPTAVLNVLLRLFRR